MRLQSERLVLSTALRGFSVAPLSREEMKDATETRILIECRSAAPIDAGWRRRLGSRHRRGLPCAQPAGRAAIAHLGRSGRRRYAVMEERHYQFHRALIAHCGSPRLLDLADQLYVETAALPAAEPDWPGSREDAARCRRRASGDHGRHASPQRRRRAPAGRALSAHLQRSSTSSIDWPALAPARRPTKSDFVSSSADIRRHRRRKPRNGNP